MLVANSITGAATLFRREVAELALPFPDTPGLQFHDHWLGLVALAAGDIAYVDRPLYDYVQHAGAVFGEVSRRAGAPAGGCCAAGAARTSSATPAREVQAQTLLVRCGPAHRRKRRALEPLRRRRALAGGLRLAGGPRPLRLATRPWAASSSWCAASCGAAGVRPRRGADRSPTRSPSSRGACAAGAPGSRLLRRRWRSTTTPGPWSSRRAGSRRRSASPTTGSTRSRSAPCIRSRARVPRAARAARTSRSTSTRASSSGSSAATARARARC